VVRSYCCLFVKRFAFVSLGTVVCAGFRSLLQEPAYACHFEKRFCWAWRHWGKKVFVGELVKQKLLLVGLCWIMLDYATIQKHRANMFLFANTFNF
jgi:hypothetical protein